MSKPETLNILRADTASWAPNLFEVTATHNGQDKEFYMWKPDGEADTWRPPQGEGEYWLNTKNGKTYIRKAEPKAQGSSSSGSSGGWKGKGGGGGPRGKSPSERASIEAQVALKEAVQLVIAKDLELNMVHEIADDLYKWLQSKRESAS